jgi:hypothetical protein
LHGLPEAALGVVAVECNAVYYDGDDFDYYFDDAADKRPVLEYVSIDFRDYMVGYVLVNDR